MLGQDVRLGLLAQGGFEKAAPALYRRESVWLHQLALSSHDGIYYSREKSRFFEVAPGTLPPQLPEDAKPLKYREGWRRLRHHLLEYENWLQRVRPGYRARLLRICPQALRPYRRAWRQDFLNIEVSHG